MTREKVAVNPIERVSYPFYRAGDIWGCIGRWYSGQWYSQDALNYIERIKKMLWHRSLG
jgi:hypothetical protein